MSKLAYADMAVQRAELSKPGRKFQIRQQLLAKLHDLGYVDSVVGFAIDPPDGPYRDGTFEEVNRDKVAIIRVAGYVTPLKP